MMEEVERHAGGLVFASPLVFLASKRSDLKRFIITKIYVEN